MGGSRKFDVPHSAFRNRTLSPVILPVPKEVGEYKPRDRVIFLSAHARKALVLSAQKSGIDISLADFNKDPDGIPLPVDGIYWSLTHKTEYVGAVLSSQPAGIDIEKVTPCSPGLFRRTAGEEEWVLADPSSDKFTVFYRYWTAKEAVVKASTIGIKDLLKCRIHRIIDDHHLEIKYLDKLWQIEHFFFGDHIASLVYNNFKIEWTIG
jgi:4'-phosphopantetheinyl transferase